jgi:squalene synthase HpnC
MIVEQLARWGPESNAPAPSLTESRAYCRRLARTHYENFPVVTWLLPRRLRQPFYDVYAYCRWADDLGDETGDPGRSLELFDWWKGELAACFDGRCRHPVFVALHETIREHRLPRQPFEELISAFVQDQLVHEYETFDQLLDYCRRSANPVGRILLHLMDAARLETFDASDAICTGLQLTNFWQDVRRDHEMGRVYLPREDRDRFGYSDEDMAQRRTTPQFIDMMKFQVARARSYLERGALLADHLSGRVRLDIELFRQGGLAILRKIEQANYRAWDERQKLTRWDIFKACAGVLTSRRRPVS